MEGEGRGNSPGIDEEFEFVEDAIANGPSCTLIAGTGTGAVDETIGGREEFKNAEAVPEERRAAFNVLNGGGDLLVNEDDGSGVRLREVVPEP